MINTENSILYTAEEGMKIEYESAIDLSDTRDFSEGIKAFLEKRKPSWD